MFFILSISTAVTCFVLGLLVLLKNVFNNLSFTFFIFSWFVTIWALVSYAFFIDQSNFLLYKIAYAMGGACLLTTAPWVFYLLKKKPSKYLITLFYAASIFLITIPFWDKSAITNFASHNNTYTFSFGPSYYLYSAVIFLTVLYLFYILLKSIFKTSGEEQYRIIFVFTGLFIYFFGELAFGLILPILDLTPSAPLDNLAAISFMGFASFGLLKFDKDL